MLIFKTNSSLLLWYIRLRYFAFLGQSFVFFLALYIFKLSLPSFYIILCILSIPITNILISLFNFKDLIEERIISLLLIFDTILLTIILCLSGGPVNPFSIFYLVHLTLAAILLGSFWTWILAIISSIGFFLLFKFSIPVPEWEHHQAHNSLSLHLQGMLYSYISVAFLMAYFLNKIIQELISKQKKLQHLKDLQSNQQKLASITTATAGAAHELGTPLNTITLIVDELEYSLKDLPLTPRAKEDITILKEQTNRCAKILNSLQGNSSSIGGESLEEVTIKDIINDAIKPLTISNLKLTIEANDYRFFLPRKSITQALRSLIKNSIESMDKENGIININTLVKNNSVKIEISDNGRGMNEETVKRLGEPFFSTKEANYGMGLGVYLAKLTAEYLGGSLSYQSEIGKGTKTIFEFIAFDKITKKQ